MKRLHKSQQVAEVTTEVQSPREVVMDIPNDIYRPAEPKVSKKREGVGGKKDLVLAGKLPQEGKEPAWPEDMQKQEVLPVVVKKEVKEEPLKGHFVVVRRYISFECGGVMFNFTPGLRYDVTNEVWRILKEERVLA